MHDSIMPFFVGSLIFVYPLAFAGVAILDRFFPRKEK